MDDKNLTLTVEQTETITNAVDIDAPPPEDLPTALFVFGTNQARPAEIAAERYQQGQAQLVIVSGGVNRHNGVVEAREFRELLLARGVPASVIRCEDTSANTWQNVELSLPFLREAQEAALTITAVGKWYHRRALHCLATLVPDLDRFYAISWEPVYAGKPVTRADWVHLPDGKRRVIREWEESGRRVREGSFRDVRRADGGAWHC